MQLSIALILFTIAQLGTIAAAVLFFRSETKSLRREVEQLRAADKGYVQLQLDTMSAGIARIEKQVADIARLVGGGKRAADSLPSKE